MYEAYEAYGAITDVVRAEPGIAIALGCLLVIIFAVAVRNIVMGPVRSRRDQ